MLDLVARRSSIALAEGEGEYLTFRGIDLIIKSPPGTSEGWTVLDYTLPPRQLGAPLHYHRQLIESFYIIIGELWMRIGDREINAKPGAFALVNPGTPHSFANRTDAPVRFLAHASQAKHKAFLRELSELAKAAPAWPPRDILPMVMLGERYDSFYL